MANKLGDNASAVVVDEGVMGGGGESGVVGDRGHLIISLGLLLVVVAASMSPHLLLRHRRSGPGPVYRTICFKAEPAEKWNRGVLGVVGVDVVVVPSPGDPLGGIMAGS